MKAGCSYLAIDIRVSKILNECLTVKSAMPVLSYLGLVKLGVLDPNANASTKI